MRNHWFFSLFFVAAIALFATRGVSAESLCEFGAAPETLTYTAAYRGVLNAGERWDIARVTLMLEPVSEEGEGQETTRMIRATLEVTSAPFENVEALYPLRFRYRSWMFAGCEGARMTVQERISPSRDDRLLWFDYEAGAVLRIKANEGKRPAALPNLLQRVVPEGKYFIGGKAPIPEGVKMLDRLALLYRIRTTPLEPESPVELAVSDGRRLLGYRVTLEGKENGEGTPQLRGALRVRLDARWSRDDSEEPPTYIWLADDNRRTPLLFRSERTVGWFEVRLDPAASVVGGAP